MNGWIACPFASSYGQRKAGVSGWLEVFADAPEGAVAEVRPALAGLAAALAARFAQRPGRALFIDYGAPRPSLGDTLQAVRRHAKVAPLEAPGLNDLSAHVDFAAVAAAARAHGLEVAGPAPQGAFLEALGLELRTEALARARPEAAEALQAARRRLAGPEGMGELFQAICLSSPGLPAPAGFA
jgi:NADH dehydrogenase [ubiquinone] 1 alpha subcomplex assembly factor 7